jgi:hypothetical protein
LQEKIVTREKKNYTDDHIMLSARTCVTIKERLD